METIAKWGICYGASHYLFISKWKFLNAEFRLIDNMKPDGTTGL
jgi:hypothetical protein